MLPVVGLQQTQQYSMIGRSGKIERSPILCDRYTGGMAGSDVHVITFTAPIDLCAGAGKVTGGIVLALMEVLHDPVGFVGKKSLNGSLGTFPWGRDDHLSVPDTDIAVFLTGL